MTEEEILEGNRIIEEFMGPRPIPPYTLPDNQTLGLGTPYYHLDWNLLINAFNELRMGMFTKHPRLLKELYPDPTLIIGPVFQDWPCLGLGGALDIDDSFRKLVSIIQWYNSVKNK